MSPYHGFGNNPISKVDANGANEDNYLISDDGSIEVQRTNDKTDNFKFKKSDGTVVDFGTFEKNENGLIPLPSSLKVDGVGFQYKGSKNENYISGSAFAALIGVLEYSRVSDLSLNHWSNADGSSPAPSKSHKNGTVGDLKPLRLDKSGGKVLVSDEQFDKTRNAKLIEGVFLYGWTSVLSEKYDGYITPKTTHFTNPRHNNHFHIQRFKPKLKEVDHLDIPSSINTTQPPILDVNLFEQKRDIIPNQRNERIIERKYKSKKELNEIVDDYGKA